MRLCGVHVETYTIYVVSVYVWQSQFTRSRRYTQHTHTHCHRQCQASPTTQKYDTIDPKRSHPFIFMICHLFHWFLSFLCIFCSFVRCIFPSLPSVYRFHSLGAYLFPRYLCICDCEFFRQIFIIYSCTQFHFFCYCCGWGCCCCRCCCYFDVALVLLLTQRQRRIERWTIKMASLKKLRHIKWFDRIFGLYKAIRVSRWNCVDVCIALCLSYIVCVVYTLDDTGKIRQE